MTFFNGRPLSVYFAVRVRCPVWSRDEYPRPHGWARFDLDAETLARIFDAARQCAEEGRSIAVVPGSEPRPYPPQLTRVRMADASDNHHDFLLANYWTLDVFMTPGAILAPTFRKPGYMYWFTCSQLPVKLLKKVMATQAGAHGSPIVTWPQALQMGDLLFVDPKPRRLLDHVASQRPGIRSLLERAG